MNSITILRTALQVFIFFSYYIVLHMTLRLNDHLKNLAALAHWKGMFHTAVR